MLYEVKEVTEMVLIEALIKENEFLKGRIDQIDTRLLELENQLPQTGLSPVIGSKSIPNPSAMTSIGATFYDNSLKKKPAGSKQSAGQAKGSSRYKLAVDVHLSAKSFALGADYKGVFELARFAEFQLKLERKVREGKLTKEGSNHLLTKILPFGQLPNVDEILVGFLTRRDRTGYAVEFDSYVVVVCQQTSQELVVDQAVIEIRDEVIALDTFSRNYPGVNSGALMPPALFRAVKNLAAIETAYTDDVS